jgi:hypothetical protein
VIIGGDSSQTVRLKRVAAELRSKHRSPNPSSGTGTVPSAPLIPGMLPPMRSLAICPLAHQRWKIDPGYCAPTLYTAGEAACHLDCPPPIRGPGVRLVPQVESLAK